MLIAKRILQAERLRRVPPHFSWIDHRLVRADFMTIGGTALQKLLSGGGKRAGAVASCRESGEQSLEHDGFSV